MNPLTSPFDLKRTLTIRVYAPSTSYSSSQEFRPGSISENPPHLTSELLRD